MFQTLCAKHTRHDKKTTNPPISHNHAHTYLRTVGSWSCVGHGELSGLGVLDLKVLVRKLLAVDALTAYL